MSSGLLVLWLTHSSLLCVCFVLHLLSLSAIVAENINIKTLMTGHVSEIYTGNNICYFSVCMLHLRKTRIERKKILPRDDHRLAQLVFMRKSFMGNCVKETKYFQQNLVTADSIRVPGFD